MCSSSSSSLSALHLKSKYIPCLAMRKKSWVWNVLYGSHPESVAMKACKEEEQKAPLRSQIFWTACTIPNIPCQQQSYYAVILVCHVAIGKKTSKKKRLLAFACLACCATKTFSCITTIALPTPHHQLTTSTREREKKKWTCEQNVHTHIRTLQLLTAFIKRGKEKERMSEKREEEELCVTLLWHSITFKLIGSVRKLNWEFSSSCTVNTRKSNISGRMLYILHT